MDRFEELYGMLERELSKILSRGELNSSSLDMVYKLTCSMKNLKKIMGGGYSNYSGDYSRNYGGRGYSNEYSQDGYSREGYSRNYSGHNMREHLEEAMKQAKDDRTRNEIMRMLERM